MTPEEALELFAAVPVGILSVTREGVIRGGNFAAARLLDVPLRALPGRSLLPENAKVDERSALLALFEQGRFDERDLPFVGNDGRNRGLRASGRPLPDGSVAVIVRDPSADAARERRRLIELKMDALGRLASGVAHEYGNVMATLSGYAQLAVHDPSMKDELVEAVISSAPRVRSVTDALRAFERVPSGEFEPFDLADVVHRVAGILGPEIERAGARLDRNLGSRGPVLGQRAAIEEAVLAVVRNAVEACRGGGTVTLTLSTDEERVVLLVADTGPGIPDDFRDRVFDPFFTTKGSLGGGQYQSGGGGLGLGLAVAGNSLRSHDGDVELVTNASSGTAF
ncbi:hypothetical protein HY251_20435, partial [bacterium]|nr:hypothetical protein [bacterium]